MDVLYGKFEIGQSFHYDVYLASRSKSLSNGEISYHFPL